MLRNLPFPSGSLKARLAHGGLLSLASSVTTQATAMIASILCARILDKQEFGELSMARSTILMLSVFAGSGLGLAVAKFVAEFRDTDKARAGRLISLFLAVSCLLGVVATVLCVVLAEPLARHAMANPHLSVALALGSGTLLVSTLGSVQNGILIGLENFREVTRLTIIEGLLNLVLIPCGALIAGAAGAITASSAAAIAMYPIKRWRVQQACAAHNVQITGKSQGPERATALNFMLPAVLVGVSAQPFDWLIRLILVNGPDGYSEVALFTVVNMLAQLVIFVPGQIGAPTQSVLANLLGTKQSVQAKRVLIKGTVVMALTAVLSGILLMLVSDFLLSLYGSDYVGGKSALAVLTVACVLSASTPIVKNFLYARDRVWSVVWAHILMGGVLCATALALQQHGALAVCIAYVLGWLTLFLYEMKVAHDDIRSWHVRTS